MDSVIQFFLLKENSSFRTYLILISDLKTASPKAVLKMQYSMIEIEINFQFLKKSDISYINVRSYTMVYHFLQNRIHNTDNDIEITEDLSARSSAVRQTYSGILLQTFAKRDFYKKTKFKPTLFLNSCTKSSDKFW